MVSFEKWLVDNQELINPAAYGLFEDSIRCMKFDIVRPAYLMAYQGMIRHLRDVIVFGERPADLFNEAAWAQILKGLSLDDPDVKWDDNTYDRIRQGSDKSKPVVLNMPNEARSKFPYWRELRNVCAHNKEYKFLKAHTLTLYAFIEQFLLRMSVEGGMQQLLNQFDDFYNPVLSSADKDDFPLILRIPSLVTTNELLNFIKECNRIRHKYHRYNSVEFTLKLLDNLPEGYRTTLLQEIKAHDSMLENILEHDPERILTFATTPELVRKAWYRDSIVLSKGNAVVAHLMEAGKMSDSDKNEFFNRTLSRLYKYNNSWNDEDWVTEVFRKHGFFKMFLDEYFCRSFTSTTSNMSKICYSMNFYESMIRTFDVAVDDTFVQHIVEVFTPSYPYTLQSWFKRDMIGDAEFADKLNERIVALGLTLPDNLRSAENNEE